MSSIRNASGVVSGGIVVVLNVSFSVPTVRIVFTLVQTEADDVFLTAIVSQLFTLHVDDVNDQRSFIEYSPPDMLTVVAVFIPVIVITFETYSVLRVAFVTSEKLNESGVVSGGGAGVVTLKFALTPHIVNVVVLVVEFEDDAVSLTLTLSFASTVHTLDVNAQPLILYVPLAHDTDILAG
jgi:hypothetical protein